MRMCTWIGRRPAIAAPIADARSWRLPTAACRRPARRRTRSSRPRVEPWMRFVVVDIQAEDEHARVALHLLRDASRSAST